MPDPHAARRPRVGVEVGHEERLQHVPVLRVLGDRAAPNASAHGLGHRRHLLAAPARRRRTAPGRASVITMPCPPPAAAARSGSTPGTAPRRSRSASAAGPAAIRAGSPKKVDLDAVAAAGRGRPAGAEAPPRAQPRPAASGTTLRRRSAAGSACPSRSRNARNAVEQRLRPQPLGDGRDRGAGAAVDQAPAWSQLPRCAEEHHDRPARARAAPRTGSSPDRPHGADERARGDQPGSRNASHQYRR